MANANPTYKKSTHHLVMTKDSNSLGLILCDSQGNALRHGFRQNLISGVSLQIHEGEGEYSDLELPWRTIQQTDWSGGLGRKYLDDDSTAYGYGDMMDTNRENQVVAGPALVYTTGYRTYYKLDVSQYDRGKFSLNNTYTKLGVTFTSTATTAYSNIVVYLRKVGSPTGNIKIALYSSSAGSPNAELASATVDASTLYRYFTKVGKSLSYTPSAATDYWVVIDYSGGTASNYVDVLTYEALTAGKSYSGGAWASTNNAPAFRLTTSVNPRQAWFFEYKRALYALMWYDDRSAATALYKNGDCGVADAGSTVTLLDDSAKSWTVDEWAQCVCILTRGTGSDQKRNYDKILSNTGTRLTMTNGFDVAPDGTTEYVIVASNKWTEITGHGLGQYPVTDVMVTDGAIYACQGNNANVRRLRYYNNAGTWTAEYTDEGYKAQFMKPYSTAAGAKICATLPGVPAQIKTASPVDHSANAASATTLTLSSAVTVGDLYEQITGLEVYKYGQLHILKEHSIHYVDEQDDIYQLEVSELDRIQDPSNGAAHVVNQENLWFSLMEGAYRYSFTNSVIDGMGYEKTELGYEKYGGGNYQHLNTYPGRVIACIDAGRYSTGKLMSHNLSGRDGVGWCNLYTGVEYSTTSNEKIYRTYVQSIPGVNVNRLWVSINNDIAWMPISSDPWGMQWVTTANMYPFTPFGVFETSWITTKYHMVDKLWKSISVYVEHYQSSSSNRDFEFTLEYDIDDGNGWQAISTAITTTGNTTIDLSSSFDVSSKRIRFRFGMYNGDMEYTPRISAVMIDSLVRVPIRWQANMFVRIADGDTDLNGEFDPQDADEKLSLLTTFMSSPEPVLITSISRLLHNKYWVVEPSELVPLKNEPVSNQAGEENSETHAYALRIFEVRSAS